jgi:NADH dehydrogenase FAD-containing subunit
VSGGSSTRVVLLGAGHTHLHVLRRARQLAADGIGLTLVAPAVFEYSGAATAAATGSLPPAAGRIDVAALTRRRGIEHLVGRAGRVDVEARTVELTDGRRVGYDLLSCNLGSVTAAGTLVIDPHVLRVKPLERLHELLPRLHATTRGTHPTRVSVIGGGPTGLELAGNLAARWGSDVAVTLFDRNPQPGSDLPLGARRKVVAVLARRGVRIRTDVDVRAVDVGEVLDGAGVRSGHDLAILASGLVPHPDVIELGLGDRDGIPVRATLQHVAHDEIYAVGDSARFLPRPLPKLGVYGVRQGPVLAASLVAQHRGAPLPRFEPQPVALRILDLGGGVGLATRGRWWWYGRAARRLKLAIDRRWLRRSS